MASKRTKWLMSAPVSATTAGSETPMHAALTKLVRDEDLTRGEAAAFFRAMTDAAADPVQIAAGLTALTAKGETGEELAGMAEVMREKALHFTLKDPNTVDIFGTGSSTAKTFNVSTAASLVAAGAGLSIAKQCNRGIASSFGGADLVKELGLKIAETPDAAQTSLNATGVAFILAAKFHPALARVAAVRRTLGIRTCLNLLGSLTNPAGVKRQLTGVWHVSLAEPFAEALAMLGSEMAWVVHGADGLDEISIAEETLVIQAANGKIKKLKIKPEDFGLKRGKLDGIRASSAKESAEIVADVLASKRRDEARSIVVLNAAAALMIGGVAKEPLHAARMAEQSIDSGQAQNKLERLTQLTSRSKAK